MSVSENKVLVRKLQRMMGKPVSVKGELEQLPENVSAAVPPFGIFVEDGFEIQEIKN
ncbi:MAG: hypothetical protein AB7V18_09625 [Pyrinomonadaceae bacterium]